MAVGGQHLHRRLRVPERVGEKIALLRDPRRVALDNLLAQPEHRLTHGEAVGIGKRRPAEQRRVDEAEDGGVGADAQAENEDGGGREAPVAGQTPGCVAGVAHERADGRGASRIPAHLL